MSMKIDIKQHQIQHAASAGEIEAASLICYTTAPKEAKIMKHVDNCTQDGSFDRHGEPAIKNKTGRWRSATLLLVSEGLAAVAFAGLEANMVLFSKSVLRHSNAYAATLFSRWMGAVSLFAVLGAFLSDSYMGRYFTCVVFQAVMILGLLLISLSTREYFLEPKGCGKIGEVCNAKSSFEMAIFYVSIYLTALGSGTMEPALGTFGADQFDEEDIEENKSKSTFFSYYYVALNVGSLIGETALVYIETIGKWEVAFWISTLCGFLGLVSLLLGSWSYRHFRPFGNPLSRFFQVIVASIRNMKAEAPPSSFGEQLFELPSNNTLSHTEDFKFLDRAAFVVPQAEDMELSPVKNGKGNPWRLCTVTQVEEVKCVLRLIPIWFCIIIASIVFVQVFSLFVEQGAAMNREITTGIFMPPASMTAFDILSTSTFIVCYDKLLVPMFEKVFKSKPKNLTDLQKIGVGLMVSIVAMITAALVEQHRLKHMDRAKESSSLTIFWQIPQYVLVGIAEAFVTVAQWDFFVSELPNGLKTMGLALGMTSSALGSYLCSILLAVVMKITTKNGQPGWLPSNLNDGHLDKFFFLTSVLLALDLLLFIVVAKRYKSKI